MKELLLFTDGSVDVKSKIGFGAYLFLSKRGATKEELKEQVKVIRFENTSSSKLELQTLLAALNDTTEQDRKILVYTDSQNITGLIRRRNRFEKNNYLNKSNELIKNHELYKSFFAITDKLNCDFIKVRGHQPSRSKDEIHTIFGVVDKAARFALRKAFPRL